MQVGASRGPVARTGLTGFLGWPAPACRGVSVSGAPGAIGGAPGRCPADRGELSVELGSPHYLGRQQMDQTTMQQQLQPYPEAEAGSGGTIGTNEEEDLADQARPQPGGVQLQELHRAYLAYRDSEVKVTTTSPQDVADIALRLQAVATFVHDARGDAPPEYSVGTAETILPWACDLLRMAALRIDSLAPRRGAPAKLTGEARLRLLLDAQHLMIVADRLRAVAEGRA